MDAPHFEHVVAHKRPLVTAKIKKPTPTATITAPPEDPAITLGQATGRDNLDGTGGFGLSSPYDDGTSRMSISNGVMNLSSTSTQGWRGWRLRPPELTNAYIEATFNTVSCSGSDTWGVVFRARSYDSGFGYYYGMTCDGRYSLSRWDDNGTRALISLTSSDKILSGNGQTNRLGIWTQGNRIKLYMNGKLIHEIDDTAFTKGYYGPFISGYSGGLSVQLDGIAYWNIP